MTKPIDFRSGLPPLELPEGFEIAIRIGRIMDIASPTSTVSIPAIVPTTRRLSGVSRFDWPVAGISGIKKDGAWVIRVKLRDGYLGPVETVS